MRSLVELIQRIDKLGGDIQSSGADEAGSGAWGLAAQIGDLRVIIGCGASWDHISVSLAYRVPSYEEMKAIKRLCFRDDEWAMELHAPPSKHISRHPYVLHLWRPHDVPIPTPPEIMV
jgi:hypothetical protein